MVNFLLGFICGICVCIIIVYPRKTVKFLRDIFKELIRR